MNRLELLPLELQDHIKNLHRINFIIQIQTAWKKYNTYENFFKKLRLICVCDVTSQDPFTLRRINMVYSSGVANIMELIAKLVSEQNIANRRGSQHNRWINFILTIKYELLLHQTEIETHFWPRILFDYNENIKSPPHLLRWVHNYDRITLALATIKKHSIPSEKLYIIDSEELWNQYVNIVCRRSSPEYLQFL